MEKNKRIQRKVHCSNGYCRNKELNKDPTLFAVVDTEKLGLIDLPNLTQWVKLHEDLIRT